MKGSHPGSRGPGGRRGGWQQAELPDAGDAGAWFTGRLPDEWFDGPVDVTVDRDEITVIGTLTPPDTDNDDNAAAAAQGRASRFREDTRGERMSIADEAQARYARKVSWGVKVGDERILFTHITGTPGPGHLGRRRGRPVACRCTRVVGQTRRCPHRRMAGQTAFGDGRG